MISLFPLIRLKTFASKLIVSIASITVLVVLVISVIMYQSRSHHVMEDKLREVEIDMANTALNINRQLNAFESAMGSNTWMIDRCVTLHQEDSVFSLLKNILDYRNSAYGCGVAFNVESATPDRKPEMYYVKRDTLGYMHMRKIELPRNIKSSDYSKYAWLRNPLISNSAQWSAVHDAPIDANMDVCTFAIPVGNRNDEEKAVFFLDIDPNILGQYFPHEHRHMVRQMFLSNPNAKCIYLNQDPDMKYPLDFNPSEVQDILDYIGDNMAAGRSGEIKMDYAGQNSLIYFNVLNDSKWALFSVARESLDSASRFAVIRTVLIVFVSLLVLIYLIHYYVIKDLTKPLKLFTDSTLEISKGNFDADLPLDNTYDEMSALYQSFAAMKHSIMKYTKDLEETTRHQAFIMGELQIASKIQDDMLPKDFPPFPERDDMDLVARLLPAKEIGGDLYNYFIKDNKLYFIIADVSGKSVPAALIMAIANNVFNIVAPMHDDPSDIVEQLNETTCANNHNSGFFITAIVGTLDLITHEAKICNAGHNPPLMVASDGKVRILKIAPNLPIGVLSNYEYKSEVFQASPNEKIVLYTDGITDAEDYAHKFYGIDRLVEVVQKNAKDSIGALADKIISDVQAYSKGMDQTDDITLMITDFKPSEVTMKGAIVLDNDINELKRVAEFSDAVAEAVNLDQSKKMKLNIVLEEAISNIIFYSFPKGSQNYITLYAAAHNHELIVIISDTGKKFDPTTRPDADTSAPLEKRQVGGLGITIMRTISENISYQRLYNKNFLTLRFTLD